MKKHKKAWKTNKGRDFPVRNLIGSRGFISPLIDRIHRSLYVPGVENMENKKNHAPPPPPFPSISIKTFPNPKRIKNFLLDIVLPWPILYSNLLYELEQDFFDM